MSEYNASRADRLKLVLRENFIKATTTPGNCLDEKMHQMQQQLLRSRSFPLSLHVLLSQVWFYCLLGILAVPFTVLGGLGAQAYLGNWEQSARYLRLTATVASNSSAALSDAGLLLDGCRAGPPGLPAWLAAGDGASLLDLGGPVRFNGWYLTTGDQDPALDPGAVALYGSLDNATWRLVGAPSWVHTAWGEVLLRPAARPALPGERRRDAVFDMRAPWPWLLGDVVAPLAAGAGLAAAAAAGFARRAAGCSAALAGTLLVLLAVYFTAAVGGAAAGAAAAAPYWFGALWAAAALAGAPAHRPAGKGAALGAALVAASLYRSLALYGPAGPCALWSDSLYVGGALLLLAAAAALDRRSCSESA